MNIVRLKLIFLFLSVFIFYSAWMTGATFRFSECTSFPNYNMLAQAFINGHLHIEETPPYDTVLKDGHRYIFSGPVPALLRVPFLLVSGKHIPTGLMIAFYCAGVIAFLARMLKQLTDTSKIEGLSTSTGITLVALIFSGISLNMVTIPSIHHESICAAMFFMMVSIHILLRIVARETQSVILPSCFFAICLWLAVGSRFSYVFAALTLQVLLALKLFKTSEGVQIKRAIQIVSIVSLIGIISLGLLLFYNYARFGAFLDFGTQYIVTFSREYFDQIGYFRYDHLPYNVWSLFFRIPQFEPVFPFVILPRYFIQANSIGIGPYFLLNANELTVSVFFLMPILGMFFVPMLFKEDDLKFPARLLFAAFMAQILSFGFTIASIARYYYDFVPLLMILVFIGIVLLKKKSKLSNGMIAFLGSISIIISFSLPMNAILFYSTFINYQSPLLKLFF